MAREFGWTPKQVQALTMGQVDLYMEMIAMQQEATHG